MSTQEREKVAPLACNFFMPFIAAQTELYAQRDGCELRGVYFRGAARELGILQRLGGGGGWGW